MTVTRHFRMDCSVKKGDGVDVTYYGDQERPTIEIKVTDRITHEHEDEVPTSTMAMTIPRFREFMEHIQAMLLTINTDELEATLKRGK